MYRRSSNVNSLVKKDYEDILCVREKAPRSQEIGVIDESVMAHSKR